MRSNRSENTVQRRFMSFISYAFSSIVFDIFAYAMSGKVVGLLNSQQNYLFYFPLFSYNLASLYVPNLISIEMSLANFRGLILLLPVITFIAGILLQKGVSRKAGKYNDFSQFVEKPTEN